MKPNACFGSAFRRAASFFPTAAVAMESEGQGAKVDGLCVVSFDPPVVALTFAPAGVPNQLFEVSAGAAVRLKCRAVERKEVGDHVMVFAAVEDAEISGGEVLVNWRGAAFGLRLEYPFLASAESLEAFVNDWRMGSLPKSAWTHAAHVGVTGYYAFDRTADEVFGEMRPGILKHNVAVGGVNGPDSGYHETLTRFWSITITRAVHGAKPQSRLEAARCAVRIFGEDRDLPALFYSFNVVRDQRARREWVAPDLEPRDEWVGAR
jgi:hypothetical protein